MLNFYWIRVKCTSESFFPSDLKSSEGRKLARTPNLMRTFQLACNFHIRWSLHWSVRLAPEGERVDWFHFPKAELEWYRWKKCLTRVFDSRELEPELQTNTCLNLEWVSWPSTGIATTIIEKLYYILLDIFLIKYAHYLHSIRFLSY